MIGTSCLAFACPDLSVCGAPWHLRRQTVYWIGPYLAGWNKFCHSISRRFPSNLLRHSAHFWFFQGSSKFWWNLKFTGNLLQHNAHEVTLIELVRAIRLFDFLLAKTKMLDKHWSRAFGTDFFQFPWNPNEKVSISFFTQYGKIRMKGENRVWMRFVSFGIRCICIFLFTLFMRTSHSGIKVWNKHKLETFRSSYMRRST